MTSSQPFYVSSPALLFAVTSGPPLFGPDRRNDPSRERMLGRVRGEFQEMPCLRLTLSQSHRLFGLREDVCRRILDTLAAEGLLWVGPDGRYGTRLSH